METCPGTVKIQNPPGAHDDIVTAFGMVGGGPDRAPRGAWLGVGAALRPVLRTLIDARPALAKFAVRAR